MTIHPRRLNRLIRICSVILVAAFLTQSILWACPDILNNKSADKLATPSFLQDKSSHARTQTAFAQIEKRRNETEARKASVINNPDSLNSDTGNKRGHLLTSLKRIISRYFKTSALHSFIKAIMPKYGQKNISLIRQHLQKIQRSNSIIKSLSKETRVAFVIPLYNEIKRLRPRNAQNPFGEDAFRKKVTQFQLMRKENSLFNWRIYIADDGSTDDSADYIKSVWEQIRKEYPEGEISSDQLRIVSISPAEKKTLGSKKGGAVLLGLKNALEDGWAEYIGYTDMDRSTNMRQAGILLDSLYNGNAEVAIGSRWTGDAFEIRTPLSGKISSKIYNYFVRLILPPLRNIKDTQRGFKLFKRVALSRILGHAKDMTFSFDTELLLLAKLAGCRIKEEPIFWADSPEAATFHMPSQALSALINVAKQSYHIFNNPFEPAFKISDDTSTNGINLSVVDIPYKHILLSGIALENETTEEALKRLFRQADEALLQNGCDKGSIVKQVIFLKNLSDEDACRKIVQDRYLYGNITPATSYVVQAPVNGKSVSLEIIAVPQDKGVKVIRIDPYLTIVEKEGIRWAHVAGLEPRAGIEDAYEQATDILNRMRKLLEDNGFSFENVLRTWIYQGNITAYDKDGGQRYNKLNRARWELFENTDSGTRINFWSGFPMREIGKGMVRYPASTGISMNDGSFVMECLAVSDPGKTLDIMPLTNPRQREVYEYTGQVLKGRYPPLFSRGVSVTIGNDRMVFVSGTASIIDEKSIGNDAREQAIKAVENVSLVLNDGLATLNDVAQLRVYIKEPKDYEEVKKIITARFGNTPRIDVIAGVCRQDLLVELEAVAYVKNSPPPSPATLTAADMAQLGPKELPKGVDLMSEDKETSHPPSGQRVKTSKPVVQNESAVTQPAVAINETDKILSDMHEIFKNGTKTHPVPQGAKILLSETLFNDVDRVYLSRLLGEDSFVKILSPREIRNASINRNRTTQNLACIINQKDYDDPELWNKNHRANNRAAMLILSEDLQDSRYLYLEGVVGLAHALANKDTQAIERYMSILFNKTRDISDAKLLELLLNDPREFSDHIRFKTEPFDKEKLYERYKADVENYLIAA